ncbi:BON domain-containing protein [Oleiharenicola lentus]|uniref:BON domain-containing protein n=1 Tax=Oleiharenicola lentus TaxID=2508720 RepID=UPI003F66A5F0
MKNAIIFFLLGLIAGAFGWHYYQRSQATKAYAGNPTVGQRVDSAVERSKDAAVDAKDAVVNKTSDWNLNSDSIKRELSETGRVVRSKAKVVGERIDDARIVTVLKGKYLVEKELSTLAINVDCRDGNVTLHGTAPSEALIGRAITLALETSGVTNVESRLAVR